MEKYNTGVYAIINLVNDKMYIGSASRSFTSRWNDHKNQLKKSRHPNIHLQRAWNTYGESSFTFKILKRCLPEKCIKYEQIYLDVFDTFKYGYNRSPTAGSIKGVKFSETTKDKQRQRMLGVPMRDWVKEKIGTTLKGKAKTPEHKKNIWKNRIGWKHSEESKKKTSETLKRVIANGVRIGWVKGALHSDEAKKKMSLAGKGKPKSEEHKAKIKAAHIARAERLGIRKCQLTNSI